MCSEHRLAFPGRRDNKLRCKSRHGKADDSGQIKETYFFFFIGAHFFGLSEE